MTIYIFWCAFVFMCVSSCFCTYQAYLLAEQRAERRVRDWCEKRTYAAYHTKWDNGPNGRVGPKVEILFSSSVGDWQHIFIHVGSNMELCRVLGIP